MRGERDIARVAQVHLAVVDRGDYAADRPSLLAPERLAPFVEEVAQGVGALDRRFDVDDAVDALAGRGRSGAGARLAEMCADDAAVRHSGRPTLIAALLARAPA